MSLSAERNEQFSEKEYWEQRYADESEQDFDWFKTVSPIFPPPLLFSSSLFLTLLLLIPYSMTISSLYSTS